MSRLRNVTPGTVLVLAMRPSGYRGTDRWAGASTGHVSRLHYGSMDHPRWELF